MRPSIGFVILSHNHPHQVRRLTECLGRTYNDPPIAVHHDTNQSPVDVAAFSSSVSFVQNPERTRWGRFSVVTATLRALDLLYQSAAPDWFFLLSGADYPIMSGDRVLQQLLAANVDALIEYFKVVNISENLTTELRYRRYVGLNLWLPKITPGFRLGYKAVFAIDDWRAPFGPKFVCYYGDHWFGGNSVVAKILLHPTEQHLHLQRHLRSRRLPEECYYHTILANSEIRLSKDHRRYADWSAGGPHPKTLGVEDIPAMRQSGAFFARKFAPSSAVLDELDRIIAT